MTRAARRIHGRARGDRVWTGLVAESRVKGALAGRAGPGIRSCRDQSRVGARLGLTCAKGVGGGEPREGCLGPTRRRARLHRNEGSRGMKGQSLVFVYGDGGEQLTVLSGPVAEASSNIMDFLENIGRLIYDIFADKTSLETDTESTS